MSDRTKDYHRYAIKGFTVIPLHRPKAVLTMPNGVKKPVGKAPLDAKWTTKDYPPAAKVIARCIAEERNMGVRLTDEQLIIDVDPRNGGDDGFEKLCFDIGIDADEFPRVVTGSGGFHVYMSKPADVLVRDTLESEDYNGVEFKSRGRQVVAAGSVHPNGKPYVWSTDHPPIEDGLPKCPTNLLNIIKRPPRSAISGGGQYTPDAIARALSKLPVEEFGSNESWLQVMQACHHASAGDARSEFIEWSISDPAYANDAYMIGKRWDSLHADRNDGVTYRTLNKLLRDHGATDAQIAHVDEDEFPDVEDEDDGVDDPFETPKTAKAKAKKKKAKAHKNKVSKAYAMFDEAADDDGVAPEGQWPAESESALEELNQKWVTTMENGKFKIMFQQPDSELNGRMVWLSADRFSFESKYANRMIERDKSGMSRNAADKMPLGEAWIKWPKRRDVDAIVFEPDTSKGDRDGVLNLWSGWAYQPDKRAGSWNYMREMLFEVMANGDQKIFDYVMNWCALMFQKPQIVPGTALVFRGGQGVGKGTFGNALVKTIGAHAHAIADSEQLTGRFNSHMRNLIFLFADEGTGVYNKAAEAKMRHMITEPLIQIEKKGVDLVRVRNLLHVMMASNEKWVVPAGSDERRYMVQEFGNQWKRKADKWNALHAEMNANNEGGYRALLWDMLNHKIPEGWNPREFPFTKALTEQKVASMTPMKRFWYNLLMDQQAPFVMMGDWADAPVRFFLSDFRDGFAVFCRNNDIRPGSGGRSSHSQIMGEMLELFPSAKTNLRIPIPKERVDMDGGIDGLSLALQIPPINQAMEEFELACGLPENSIKRFDRGF